MRADERSKPIWSRINPCRSHLLQKPSDDHAKLLILTPAEALPSTANLMSFKVSLWLLPPEPLRTQLERQIQEIAEQANREHPDLGAPVFVPHITVVGGVPVDPESVHDILDALKSSLTNLGSIPCAFPTTYQDQETNVLCMYRDDGSVQWNQACISVMERSPEFMSAAQSAWNILNGFRQSADIRSTTRDDPDQHARVPQEEQIHGDSKDSSLTSTTSTTEIGTHSSVDTPAPATLSFAPTIREPHFSFAYGSQNVFASRVSTPPPQFAARQMALYSTIPASPKDVSLWECLGTIDLS